MNDEIINMSDGEDVFSETIGYEYTMAEIMHLGTSIGMSTASVLVVLSLGIVLISKLFTF